MGRSELTATKCAAATENDIREEALPQIQVDAIDRVHNNLMYTGILLADDLRIEQNFWCPETFRTELSASI